MLGKVVLCVALLALSCFGLVGCENEDPQIVKEVAELVETVPASGERAAAHQPVVLYFDKAPLAVTVNGTAARVVGNSAIWSFPKPPSYGDELFHIEWTNPDGSPNVGTSIRLMVMADVAKLVRTLPANGEYAAEHLPIVLYFDKEPLAVTVNGTAARVDGNRAFWCFPYPRPQGDALFHIEWTNPDGSSNVGTDIWLRVVMSDIDPLSIVTGTVSDGDADADPNLLNRDGIRFHFNDPVIGSESKLFAEDGEDLGWEAVWDDRTVTFRPGANGKLLENGKTYLIQMFVAEAWIYDGISCECIDCSRYTPNKWTIEFMTAPE